MHQNQRGASRSTSRPRASSRSRNTQLSSFEVVRYINSTEEGRLELRIVRNFVFPGVDPKSNQKFQAVWKFLLQNKENFIVSDPLKDPQTLSGNETVWVRTILGLCKTHCRRGKDGRNRACDGGCGALHVCRTFLLRSENACPFNSKPKKCMFGHSFATEHNVELLKEHSLHGLYGAELQKLFRRRPSRTASTLPQVCIYYNKADGKRCSRENCKSLHLCSDFIQQCCDGECSRNHKLTTPQVQRVLELYAFDRSWTPEMLLDDLRHFMTARHRNETGSYSGSDDSDVSEFSEPGALFAEGFAGRDASHVSLDGSVPSSQPAGQSQSCKGCQDLKAELNKMQLTVSWLTSQVTDLKKVVDELRPASLRSSTSSDRRPQDIGQAEIHSLTSGMAAMNGLAVLRSDDISPVNAPSSESVEREPKFRRSQPYSQYSGIPPVSAQFEQKVVVSDLSD